MSDPKQVISREHLRRFREFKKINFSASHACDYLGSLVSVCVIKAIPRKEMVFLCPQLWKLFEKKYSCRPKPISFHETKPFGP